MTKEFMIMGVCERVFHNAKINDHLSSLHEHELKVYKYEGKEYVGVKVREAKKRKHFLKNVQEAYDTFKALAIGGLVEQEPILYTIS